MNSNASATELAQQLRDKINQKTKPLGALGELEQLALQVGMIQQSLTPMLRQPTVIVCAGDHGAVQQVPELSAYPAEVTAQMVLNFLAGGAAINVFAAQQHIALNIVDTGVNYTFNPCDALVDCKIAAGTANYLNTTAMSANQCVQALNNGAGLIDKLHHSGCNVVGFGEMGIGNTASAALLMALVLHLPLDQCVGAGTGLDAAGVRRKTSILERAQQRIISQHGPQPETLTALREAGGFEIATLCGAMLRAAEQRMIILIDGFITSAALLVAHAINPALLNYCVFSHCSAEAGHARLLAHFNARPLLHLDLRLGEGTGAVLAYPLLAAAVSFLNNMASFSSAGVTEKRD